MMGGVSPATCWPLRNIGIINSTMRLHLVGSLYEIYITMGGSMNIMIPTCSMVQQSKWIIFEDGGITIL